MENQIIVASVRAIDFKRSLTSPIDQIIHFFSSGKEAWRFWEQSSAKTIQLALIDYASMEDGESGLRIAKLIRAVEKERHVGTPCTIYLMADQPTSMIDQFAKRNGASGVIKRAEEELRNLIFTSLQHQKASQLALAAGYSRSEDSIADQPQAIDFEFEQKIEALNLILRRFIGAAARKVAAEARGMIDSGTLEPTEKAYIQYLASRIPSEEMQLGFLITVNAG